MPFILLQALFNTICNCYVYDDDSKKWKPLDSAAQCNKALAYGKTVFSGKLKNGIPHGFGSLYFTSPSGGWCMQQSGYWKYGKLHGVGKIKSENSSHSYTYAGMFKNGDKHGLGNERGLFGHHFGMFKNDTWLGGV